MTSWELADLLGVHESDIRLDALPNQPLHVVLELARHLDLHPADLTPFAEDVYHLPRHHQVQQPPKPSTEADAVAVLNALAHAGRPVTADYLAETLHWNTDRTTEALEHAWDNPTLGGPYALRRVASAHFTLTPRMDVLTDEQMNAIHPGNHTATWRNPNGTHRRPLQRDVLSDLDATVLHHAWHHGSVSADEHRPWAHAIAGLIDAGYLTITTDGDTVLADDVQYGLRAIDTDDVNPY
ncbi:hypothetical protein [Streptomyces sp. HYC2]|uniref:hypothetical protein n=1 Tax=Streptomyces sp. HYC2 TaxID=2955207 RepID=UPI0024814A8A|nr:hypothetical protein [Streptomyces sp. HYC2]